MSATIETLKEFASRAELEQSLQDVNGVTALIGLDAEAPRKFYAYLATETVVKAIGIICSFHGIKPALIFCAHDGTFLVGHDSKITAINSFNGQQKFSLPLNGVFFEFVSCDNDGVVIVHELGALKIDGSGKSHWNVNTDVIENFNLCEGSLTLQAMDGKRTVINIHSGKASRT
jgi:hypothetical protein